ncbi:MAG: hypothetical protein ACJ747_03400 [Gaiellaceae bacterium]|jgi:hypothetical protein
MHRQRPLAVRFPPRTRPVAQAIEQRGIVATYELHDRLLSNRSSRRRHASRPPELDDTQHGVLAALERDGYATVPFGALMADRELEAAVERQAATFIDATERGLDGDGTELRRRAGKEFLVRAYSFDGTTLTLDDAWLRACLSRRMLELANAYLHMWSKLSYVDFWYTVAQPRDAGRVASQLWHYDFDDKHLLKAFLYLADVDAETGPFEYVAGSQPGGPYHGVRPWKPMGYGRVPETDVERAVASDAIRTFTAPRGTLIFCNTSGLHRGGFATAQPRVLATATYCSPASLAALSNRNFALRDDDLRRLDNTARFAVT